jgi:hypothetical protein
MKLFTTCILYLGFSFPLAAQYVYFTASPNSSVFNMVWRINTATCEICPVLNFQFNTPYELLVLPNGDLLVSTASDGIFRFDPPNNNPVATIPGTFIGALVHPNGTIYTSSGNALSTFNPATNTFTTIGSFPANYYIYDLFFYNGQVYGMADVPPSNSAGIVQINLTNPGASIITQNPPQFYTGAISAPNGTIYVTEPITPIEISIYDYPTNSVTSVCPMPAELAYVDALTTVPAGVPELPCVCLAAAATPAQTTVNVCVPNNATVLFNNNQQPDFNDLVRYILYTNPSAPLSSIIQTNTIPEFTYTPPVLPGVTYYVAQIVGDNLNGNINLLDPCLQISNAVTVIWRPRPTLAALTVQNNNLCPGTCSTVSITLTGTPPFAYSWEVQQNGSVVTPLNVAFFVNSNPSNFQACVPASAMSGGINVVICGLTDAYCPN